MKPLLSPRDLATAIGVSESSVKRWVDNGMIRASKTAGGHRRIPVNEAVRFLRESQSTLIKPEALGLTDIASLEDITATAASDGELLFDYLRDGRADSARGLILSMYLGGKTVAQIVDGPMRFAMAELGRLWKHDENGIFWEHRATEIAISAMIRLRMLIPPRADDDPAAVGGAPAGDPYLLPTLCAAAVLESQGFNAVNLGPDTPLASLLRASQALRASLVWVSISGRVPLEELQPDLMSLASTLRAHRVPIIVGGNRAQKLALPDHPSIHIGHSMSELEAMVKGLKAAAGRIPANT